MKINVFIISALAAGMAISCCGPKELVVNTGDYTRTDTPVKVQIPKSCRDFALTETTSGASTATPSQVIKEDGVYWLYFNLDGVTPAGQERTFSLAKAKGERDNMPMTAFDDGENVILESNSQPIMNYRYAVMPAPEGVPQKFARGGFIHPAYTPSGFVYTNIQPRDHRHHYGIWNPWTRVEYDGKVYDLWNLGDSLGTVRPTNVDALYEGEVLAGFNASLDHVIFTPEGDKTIIKEQWRVKATKNGDGYLWDFDSYLEPCTDIPVTIKAYRYQGFSCRATDVWTNQNSEMMSSEGLTRHDIDNTRGRWIYTNGSNGADGMAGFMFMSYPENYDAPEPMRIWNELQNGGRGDVYVNFCPTKLKDWVLEPGNTYHLSYRVMAYDGVMDPENAERLWTDFAYPPTVTIK